MVLGSSNYLLTTAIQNSLPIRSVRRRKFVKIVEKSPTIPPPALQSLQLIVSVFLVSTAKCYATVLFILDSQTAAAPNHVRLIFMDYTNESVKFYAESDRADVNQRNRLSACNIFTFIKFSSAVLIWSASVLIA